jgi:hypothetical protein
MLSLANYFIFRSVRRILLYVTLLLIAAPLIALVEWWWNEGQYKSAKLDARLKAIPKD